MEKIIALIFGFLALILEVIISIKNPTVESITAAVFALIIIVSVFISMRKTVTLEEMKPKGNRANDKVLKLSNEIAPYIKEKKGRIYIKVVR